MLITTAPIKHHSWLMLHLSWMFSVSRSLSVSLPPPDPVGPVRLVVEQVQSQSQPGAPGVRVSWPRSRGQVDWYDLSLRDSSSGDIHSTRVMGNAAPQSGFTSLSPGSLYALTLVAVAGNKTAPPVWATAAIGGHVLLCERSSCLQFTAVKDRTETGYGKTHHV